MDRGVDRMKLSGAEFIYRFEQYCPLEFAEAGDPVGLHIGTLNKEVKKIMVTLDVRPEVVAEAIEKKIDLIIAKHPPIFRPIKRLTTDQPQQKMYADLLKHDIAIYAAHTNLDIVPNGLNDWLCEEIGIEQTHYLKQTHQIPYQKLAVFVPEEDGERMRKVLAEAGAGKMSEKYENCSFTLKGRGRFKPVGDANPTIGEVDSLETVKEEKIEVIFPENIRKRVVAAMLKNHPYEEPAYDLYTMENQPLTLGIGRIGELAKAVTIDELVDTLKSVFRLEGVKLISDQPKQKVKRIAICGGSGEKFYADALAQQADVYITGDVYYHTAHDMLADQMTVIDAGHYIEHICKPHLAALFRQWKEEENWSVEIIESEVNTDPFQLY